MVMVTHKLTQNSALVKFPSRTQLCSIIVLDQVLLSIIAEALVVANYLIIARRCTWKNKFCFQRRDRQKLGLVPRCSTSNRVSNHSWQTEAELGRNLEGIMNRLKEASTTSIHGA